MACADLGIANRGFEQCFRTTFDVLSDETLLDITLFKGGGDRYAKEIIVPCFSRKSSISHMLSLASRRPNYFIECITFAINFLPYVVKRKPDVIYFSENPIGRILWQWRCLTGQSYKLLLRNGGPINPPFFRFDGVQQLTPAKYQLSIEYGEPVDKQVVLPAGFQLSSKIAEVTPNQRKMLRQELELPIERKIIISVGALNKSHKRMNYLINEVASLPFPRPFLLILGQQEQNTPEIIQLAYKSLGPENYTIRTVSANEVARYYQASDIFALASKDEGFGRVYVEALSHGLPCLAHDSEVTRYVIGERDTLADFQKPGVLASLLLQQLSRETIEAERIMRHKRAYDKFSWDNLKLSYINMLYNFSKGEFLSKTLS